MTVLHERGVLLLRLRVAIERVVATVQYDGEGGALVGRADALVVGHRVERAVRGGDAAQTLVRVRARVRVRVRVRVTVSARARARARVRVRVRVPGTAAARRSNGR